LSDTQPQQAQSQPERDEDQAPGWQVVDGDGNVVNSGPLTHAEAAAELTEGQGE
jgi:hypothetical protein